MKSMILAFTAAVAAMAVFLAQGASGHFKLVAPQSWIVEGANGDPQKAAPCGGTTGTPSNIVEKIKGGQKLHVKVEETIYHPGHYRIALAVNSRSELPPDPEVTTKDSPRGAQSVSAVIQNPVKPPVLADGLFVHSTPPATRPQAFETDIEIPNINCAKCTLQIIQFMAEHGRNGQGDFSYHHCSDLQITADAAKPIDARWPTAR